jgi:hypothetical protein
MIAGLISIMKTGMQGVNWHSAGAFLMCRPCKVGLF